MDHVYLAYLRSAKRLNSRQVRWCLFFDRLKFTITYRPESRKVKPDALSRKCNSSDSTSASTIIPNSCFVGCLTWDVETKVQQAQGKVPAHISCPPGTLFVPDSPPGQPWSCPPYPKFTQETFFIDPPWTRTSASTSLPAPPVLTQKPPIHLLRGTCCLYLLPATHRHTLQWTSSPVYHLPRATR